MIEKEKNLRWDLCLILCSANQHDGNAVKTGVQLQAMKSNTKPEWRWEYLFTQGPHCNATSECFRNN